MPKNVGIILVVTRESSSVVLKRGLHPVNFLGEGLVCLTGKEIDLKGVNCKKQK